MINLNKKSIETLNFARIDRFSDTIEIQIEFAQNFPKFKQFIRDTNSFLRPITNLTCIARPKFVYIEHQS